MKTQKRIHCIIFIFIFIFICHYLFAQDVDTEQIAVPLTNPGKPGVLIINHFKGAIQVTGYDGIVVVVNASLRHKTHSPGNIGNGLKRISNAGIQLAAVEKNNEVTVQTNSHSKTIDLKIHVPREFSLRLKNNDYGDIAAENVSGEMEISNINGNINLVGISGSAVLTTIDGNILVDFARVTANIPMAFSSIEGKIDLRFPANLTALLKMKSENGEIFSDFNLEILKRKTTVAKTEKSGEHKVSLEEWTYGMVNGGGPEILVKSFNGNIYIRQRKKD